MATKCITQAVELLRIAYADDLRHIADCLDNGEARSCQECQWEEMCQGFWPNVMWDKTEGVK